MTGLTTTLIVRRQSVRAHVNHELIILTPTLVKRIQSRLSSTTRLIKGKRMKTITLEVDDSGEQWKAA